MNLCLSLKAQSHCCDLGGRMPTYTKMATIATITIITIKTLLILSRLRRANAYDYKNRTKSQQFLLGSQWVLPHSPAFLSTLRGATNVLNQTKHSRSKRDLFLFVLHSYGIIEANRSDSHTLSGIRTDAREHETVGCCTTAVRMHR